MEKKNKQNYLDELISSLSLEDQKKVVNHNTKEVSEEIERINKEMEKIKRDSKIYFHKSNQAAKKIILKP